MLIMFGATEGVWDNIPVGMKPPDSFSMFRSAIFDDSDTCLGSYEGSIQYINSLMTSRTVIKE